MTYGINIKNDVGRIAFSTVYQCYQFKSKFTVTPTNAIGQFTVTSARIPLVFVAPTNTTDSPYVKAIVHQGGSSWLIQVSNGVNTQPVVCYVFAVPESYQITGHGINVFNESGGVNFTSASRALKIAGYHVTTAFSGSTVTSHPVVQTLLGGVIPTSWASSSPNCGVYVGPPAAPDSPQRVVRAVAAQRSSATQVRFNASSLAFVGPAPEDEYAILGGHYILFIDRALYD